MATALRTERPQMRSPRSASKSMEQTAAKIKKNHLLYSNFLMASLSITVLLINCRRDRIGDQKSGFEPENALRGTLRGRPKGPRRLALVGGTGRADFSTPGGKGPRSTAEWSAPLETKFLRFWAGQERDSVLLRSPAPRSPIAHVFGVAPGQRLLPPPTWPDPASAVQVFPSTAAFPASAAVETRQSDRACLFASGEASGSERLRSPTQVGS